MMKGEKEMRKKVRLFMVMLCLGTVFATACGGQAKDPGTPPDTVVHPEDKNPDRNSDKNSDTENDQSEGRENDVENNTDGIKTGAVSIRIGQNGEADYTVDMYDNSAVETMLGYLSDSELLFPVYTYDDKTGYVGRDIRGNYTRDEEEEIKDIHTGELYLFGDGQLRLYFKDVENADITATPVGYVVETEDLAEMIQNEYKANKEDTWGVDVYFLITKQ